MKDWKSLGFSPLRLLQRFVNMADRTIIFSLVTMNFLNFASYFSVLGEFYLRYEQKLSGFTSAIS